MASAAKHREMSTSPPAPPPPAVDRPGSWARRSKFLLVAAAVVIAAAAGVLVGALAFGGSDDAATGDLDQACAFLGARENDIVRLEDFPGLEDPDFWRLVAVSSMFHAAGYAEGDDRLVEVGRELDTARAMFDEERFVAALNDAHDVCD